MATPEPIERESQRSGPQLIERPRLLEKLDEAKARVIALIAPAGCGKTTLARQWVASRRIAHAWYAVGPEGFDIAAVAARIATAVSTIVPGASERMLTRLSVSTDPEADAVLLAELLARELTAWPHDTRLVIDDYQSLALSQACERFVGTLVHEAPLRLLITSRARPRWASSRLRLYGELFEIGREELQMTPVEARAVLASVENDEQRAKLVELCHGWPAVLGLAARTRSSAPPRDALLSGLYDYFADELYQGASPDLRRFLCQISAAPCLTRVLLERLGGTSALELAEAAERSGFFHSVSETGERSLHPLLRAFLKHRLDERPDRVSLVAELSEALLVDERWDDVWQLIRDCDRPDLLPRLIELSLPTLLDGSRVTALESWTQFARDNELASPLLDLAEAEIAFVSGEHVKAYALALQATHHFAESSPLRWRAHAIAGRSAHFSDRLDIALDHMKAARSLAPTRNAIHHCLWTEFLCAYELEDEKRTSMLNALISIQDGSPEALVHAAQASLLLSGFRGFQVSQDISFLSAFPLLERVHPQIRSSFVVTYCDYLTRLARYSDAETALSEMWALVTDSDLSFGLPIACSSRAANAIGLRRYRHAELLLDAAEQYATSPHGSVPMHIRVYREVLALLRGDIAGHDTTIPIDDTASKCWRGLAFGVSALWSVCGGNLDAAIAYADQAERTTIHTETRALTALTRAIVAARSNSPRTMTVLTDALTLVAQHRQWNSFVWAYRAYPEIVALIASEPELVREVQPVLLSAHDQRLAERFGIPLPTPDRPRPRSEKQLSRREREVLQLVADGLSNREVAGKLFISEVTVKVHLRHIYEKLGVRNRMEAALHAVYSDETDLA